MTKSKCKNRHFKGWYIKQKGGSGTVSLIPSFNTVKGCTFAAMQVITDKNSYAIDLGKAEDIKFSDKPFYASINGNTFGERGFNINIDDRYVKIKGEAAFSSFLPLKSDIMGPYAHVPFMQCRHGVISMRHNVDGYILLNDEKYVFDNGTGYIETDSGCSFPDVYFWTQANDESGKLSVMLSVGRIPFLFRRFTGCICAIMFNNTEYRIATYKGAKVVFYNRYKAEIVQGDMKFSAELMNSGNTLILKAPKSGAMNRVIKEAPSSTVRYVFEIGGKKLFDAVLNNCGFEYSDITKRKSLK